MASSTLLGETLWENDDTISQKKTRCDTRHTFLVAEKKKPFVKRGVCVCKIKGREVGKWMKNNGKKKVHLRERNARNV